MTCADGKSHCWSLVTVTCNSAGHLRRCWSGAITGEAEWIVVDNASQDDSVDTARDLGARVIPLDRNVGFSAANNVGLADVRRPWVAFVNPDVTIGSESGLGRLAVTSEANGALVAPQLLNLDGTEQPNGRGLPFIVDKLAHRSVRLPGSSLGDYARTGLGCPTYVAWVIGAAVAGPSQTFRDLGGWDERYFIYYEDHDLGLRAWAAGIPVVVDPRVRWTHGWQRATMRAELRPWLHEFASARTFYRTYPTLRSRRGFRRSSLASGDLMARLWTPANAGGE